MRSSHAGSNCALQICAEKTPARRSFSFLSFRQILESLNGDPAELIREKAGLLDGAARV